MSGDGAHGARRAPQYGRGRGQRPGGGGFSRQEDDPPGTSRLFIAVPLPDDVRDAIGGVMEEVAGGSVDERQPGGLRWVRVDGLHLTLRFLGPTPDARIAEVGDAVRSVAREAQPFRVTLTGGGAFPNAFAPRVLWVGIASGAEELGRVARQLDGEMQRLGWPPDERPFKPHLTLARSDGVPGAPDAVTRLVGAAQRLESSWLADRLVLYRSLLGRGAARYESLAEGDLGARDHG